MKDDLLPRGKIENMLRGPFLPRDEDPLENNIHPRNILFELQIAAKMKNAGVKIIGFDDIDFIFQGHSFNVQCKRIHSIKRVEENVKKATEQISKKLNEEQNAKGIICLSLDKITGTDGKLLEVRNENDIDSKLEIIVAGFIDENCCYWRSIIDIRIIACLIYFPAVVVIKDKNLLTHCSLLTINPIARPENNQLAEYLLIKDLKEVLSHVL